MSNVLVTDGLQRKTLSVVRSLGKRGISTVVGEKISFSPAGCSSYAHKSFVYADPEKNPKKFYHDLLDQINRTSCNVLFPMDDLTLSIIRANREELEKRCVIPIPNEESFRVASDKYETFLLAALSNVDCPWTLMPNSIEDLEKMAAEIDYPVIIKPRKSSGSRGIRVVKNRKEFLFYYKEIHNQYPYPMIQEYIPQGDRFDVCLLFDSEHQLKCSFVQKELRHFPIAMGPSTVQESVVYPELIEISKRLMSKLNWTGIVEIEYMIDPRNGSPKLMEINPRFWNSLELSIQCGVDFPYYLLKVARNEPFDNVCHYEVGKRTRWLIPGDILHFLANKNRFKMNPSFFSTKKNALTDDTFLFTDPLPTVATVAACLRYSVTINSWKMMIKR